MTTIRLALAGDTMLGRGVAQRLQTGTGPEQLFDPALGALLKGADLFVLNLECCISERGSEWPNPHKAFFFRAPPVAVRALTHIGVTCVTMANNHALDFGAEALLDTRAHVEGSGIVCVGTGRDVAAARRAAILEANGFRLGVVGVTDHPHDFAATDSEPGVAFADLRHGVPAWLSELIAGLRGATDAVLVTPHWGPNMTAAPVEHVRRAAEELLDAGATLIAGHSAHVFHGVAGPILYDLGDFIDDYAIDPHLRNDLGLAWFVTLDEGGPMELEAIPLRLDYSFTRLADGSDAEWVQRRFAAACGQLGTEVAERDGRLLVRLAPHGFARRAGR